MEKRGTFAIRVVVGGRVTAAYRKEEGRWLCTALEFDILGIGETRQEAFAQMQELVNNYLLDCLMSRGPVDFLNPSEAEEGKTRDKERYHVAVILERAAPEQAVPQVIEDFAALRRFRNRILGTDLIPANV
jgi:uridylate kinase